MLTCEWYFGGKGGCPHQDGEKGATLRTRVEGTVTEAKLGGKARSRGFKCQIGGESKVLPNLLWESTEMLEKHWVSHFI